MKEVGIVISRYYEDLKWVEQITSDVDVYIYNRQGSNPTMGVPGAVAWAKPKDENDTLGGLDLSKCKANVQVINIPDDPGFEASTYAYHCWSKHDSLNNFTVFIQAHPEIYVKNVIQKLNDIEGIKYTTYIRQHSAELSPAIPHRSAYEIEFEPFCDNFGTLNPYNDYGWSPYKFDFGKAPWVEFCINMPGARLDENGSWHPAHSWNFGAGNQFIVNKKLILMHDPEYYKRIQNFCNTYMDPRGDQRPEWQQLNQGPNIMEGIWKFAF